MSKVQWVDLTDIKIERAIMAVVGEKTLTDTQICKAYSRAGFPLGVDDHIFVHYLLNLVKKDFLKSQREGKDTYYWNADLPNPFASGVGRK